MTKEEIIELSTKCRIKPDDNCSALVRVFIFDFAREVEKHVREECAERAWIALVKHCQPWNVRQDVTDAIKARGQE